MKNLILLALLLPLVAVAQNDCLQKNEKANYLNFEVSGFQLFVEQPTKGLKIESTNGAIKFENEKEKIYLQVTAISFVKEGSSGGDYSSGSDYARIVEGESITKLRKPRGAGDTVLHKHYESKGVDKDIVKYNYKVPATWAAIRQDPDMIGDESTVWVMEYTGPAGSIEVYAYYPRSKDKELSEKFMNTFCSLFVDSLDKTVPLPRPDFEVDLTGSGLEEIRLEDIFGVSANRYGRNTFSEEKTHEYMKKGFAKKFAQMKLADIYSIEARGEGNPFDDPTVEMKISSSNINICNGDFVSSKCVDKTEEVRKMVGETGQVTKTVNRKIHGLDVYETEGKVYIKGKLIAVVYSAIFFSPTKYFELEGKALENPEETLAIFKRIAESFKLTETR